jgi:hypothetical protein
LTISGLTNGRLALTVPSPFALSFQTTSFRLCQQISRMVLFDGTSKNSVTTTTPKTSVTRAARTTAASASTTAADVTLATATTSSSSLRERQSHSIYLQTLGAVRLILVLSKPCQDLVPIS